MATNMPPKWEVESSELVQPRLLLGQCTSVTPSPLPSPSPLPPPSTTHTQLLGELLLDRHNFTTMTKYISNPENLKLMMNLLRDPSRNIQFEAFHVFKVQCEWEHRHHTPSLQTSSAPRSLILLSLPAPPHPSPSSFCVYRYLWPTQARQGPFLTFSTEIKSALLTSCPSSTPIEQVPVLSGKGGGSSLLHTLWPADGVTLLSLMYTLLTITFHSPQPLLPSSSLVIALPLIFFPLSLTLPPSLPPSLPLSHPSLPHTFLLYLADDDQFNEEKMYLIRQIRELNPDTYKEPVATATASGVAKA